MVVLKPGLNSIPWGSRDGGAEGLGPVGPRGAHASIISPRRKVLLPEVGLSPERS